MGVGGVRPVEGPVLDVVPELPGHLAGPDVVRVDLRAQLGHVDGDGEEPPGAHEAGAEPARHDGQEDADGVARRQQVDEGEAVRVRARRDGGDEQRRGGLLRLAEPRGRVPPAAAAAAAAAAACGGVPRRGPGVPVLEHEVLVPLEQGPEVVEAGLREQPPSPHQPLVAGHPAQQLQRGGGRGPRRRRPRVRRVVDVPVQEVVLHGRQPEGLHGDLLAVHLVGIAQVDEGMSD